MTAAKDIEPDRWEWRGLMPDDVLVGNLLAEARMTERSYLYVLCMTAAAAIEALRAEWDSQQRVCIQVIAERDELREALESMVDFWDRGRLTIEPQARGAWCGTMEVVRAALGAQSLCVGCQQTYYCAKRGCISRAALAAKEANGE